MKPHLRSGPEAVAAEVRKVVRRSLERLGFTPIPPGLLERIEKFAATLALWGSRMNLTARPDDPNEIAFHAIDSLMPLVLRDKPGATILRNTFSVGNRVLDIGSGAGFPGLVLAAASDAKFTLCESRRKRASFLLSAIAEMDLKNATVIEIRAEPHNFKPIFEVFTARAVGDPASIYRIAAAALRTGGIAILYSSPTQPMELEAARDAGLIDYARITYEVDRREQKATHSFAIWRKR